ncbi:hypothetical protein BDR07DRAFT_1013307 [Suillus spraguei]|nr:hypothetical protein BDR07DRAFT_1013307 [Suillus spraguei]
MLNDALAVSRSQLVQVLVFWLACLMLMACHSLSNNEVRGFNAGSALATAHSHTNQFLCHGPTQQSHVSPSHAVYSDTIRMVSRLKLDMRTLQTRYNSVVGMVMAIHIQTLQ